MRNAVVVVIVVPCLLAACAPPELCRPGVTPRIEPTPRSAQSGFLHAAHAHNDYEHPRPLQDALEQGFASVEVDLWFRDDGLQVSHDVVGTKGTLDDLYLQPLEDRLANQRSVHGDGALFTLWLDLKDSTPELRERLTTALSARPWLRRYDNDGSDDDGPVRVIITGDATSRAALIDEVPTPRPFVRDARNLALDRSVDESDDDDDPAIQAVALPFADYVGRWDGVEPPTPELSRQCGCVVERAHALGREVRFFSGPDTEAAWQFQLDHGVDFINTDDLPGLAAFLRAR